MPVLLSVHNLVSSAQKPDVWCGTGLEPSIQNSRVGLCGIVSPLNGEAILLRLCSVVTDCV
jgi:hypothetical protein